MTFDILGNCDFLVPYYCLYLKTVHGSHSPQWNLPFSVSCLALSVTDWQSQGVREVDTINQMGVRWLIWTSWTASLSAIGWQIAGDIITTCSDSSYIATTTFTRLKFILGMCFKMKQFLIDLIGTYLSDSRRKNTIQNGQIAIKEQKTCRSFFDIGNGTFRAVNNWYIKSWEINNK